jgi:RecB family exonuclease
MTYATARPLIFSHSGIKNFETCPRKFYEEKIVGRFPQKPTAATLYGEQFHSAAELFIKEGLAVPDDFKFAMPLLEYLAGKEGDKHTELEMAVSTDLTPVAFKSPDAWIRGIADIVIINGDKAWVGDYKTGSDKYPDRDQLKLMSLLVFAHFPAVQTIKSALFFVLKGSRVDFKMTRDQCEAGWQDYREKTALMEGAKASGVWNPKQNGLCKNYCPVTSCSFNGG